MHELARTGRMECDFLATFMAEMTGNGSPAIFAVAARWSEGVVFTAVAAAAESAGAAPDRDAPAPHARCRRRHSQKRYPAPGVHHGALRHPAGAHGRYRAILEWRQRHHSTAAAQTCSCQAGTRRHGEPQLNLNIGGIDAKSGMAIGAVARFGPGIFSVWKSAAH